MLVDELLVAVVLVVGEEEAELEMFTDDCDAEDVDEEEDVDEVSEALDMVVVLVAATTVSENSPEPFALFRSPE